MLTRCQHGTFWAPPLLQLGRSLRQARFVTGGGALVKHNHICVDHAPIMLMQHISHTASIMCWHPSA